MHANPSLKCMKGEVLVICFILFSVGMKDFKYSSTNGTSESRMFD